MEQATDRERVSELTQNNKEFAVFDDLDSWATAGRCAFDRAGHVCLQDWPEHGPVFPVEFNLVSPKTMRYWYEFWTELNAEGVVVHGEYGIWKIKPLVSLDVAVIGYEMKGDEIRSVLVAMQRANGWQVIGSVGSGPGLDDLDLEAHPMPTGAPVPTGRGTVYQRCLPVTVTVECVGLSPSEWPHLSEVTTVQPSVAMTGARLMRMRGDYALPTWGHQIERVVGRLPMRDSAEMAAASVLSRVVAVNKGKVRKALVMMRGGTGEFSLLTTDYSPTRKVPMQQKVQVFSSHMEAASALATWKVKNIKRGWEVIS